MCMEGCCGVAKDGTVHCCHQAQVHTWLFNNDNFAAGALTVALLKGCSNVLSRALYQAQLQSGLCQVHCQYVATSEQCEMLQRQCILAWCSSVAVLVQGPV